jgi:Tol biopolymer transport system component
VWSRNGERVAYSSNADIHWRAADGSSAAERLLARDRPQYAHSWSRDGTFLTFMEEHPTDGYDIWVLRLNGEPRPLLTTPARDMHGAFSPDGRWLAYSSDESGRSEIYVRPFPNVSEGKWTVSTAGGHSPVWSPDGHELFYMNGPGLTAVPVQTQAAAFVAGTPSPLFTGPFDTTQDNNYDIAPDGASFVMVEANPDTRPTRLHLVLNWSEELKRLVQ